MSVAGNKWVRRAGIASVAAASYGAIVYFTYSFMTVNVEKNKEAIQASFGTSQEYEKHPHSEGCNCYSAVLDPQRVKTFNKIAEVYDEQIGRDEKVMLLPLLRRALIWLNAKGKVLEVGAGTGRNLDYYSSSDVEEVVLTDVSEEMLLQARSKVKTHKYKDKFQLFVADATNMRKYYEPDSFDTIVDTFGLCSFDDPVAVLKELQRICKKDGKILLLEHGRSKSWDGLSKYLDKNAERHATNWGCVWNRDLDDIMKQAGLKIVDLQTWHFGTTYCVVCEPCEKVKKEMVETSDSTTTANDAVVTNKELEKNGIWNRWFKRGKMQ